MKNILIEKISDVILAQMVFHEVVETTDTVIYLQRMAIITIPVQTLSSIKYIIAPHKTIGVTNQFSIDQMFETADDVKDLDINLSDNMPGSFEM